MRANRLSILAILITVMSTSVAYASLSQTLQINGSATVQSSAWNVHFENISEATIDNSLIASVGGTPQLSPDNTVITNVNATFQGGPAEISYTLDVVNDGTLDAKLASIVFSELECVAFDVPVGEEALATSFASDVCSNMTYDLTYSNGTDITIDDTLNVSESKELKFTLSFNRAGDAPYRVRVNNINVNLNYAQQ